MTSLSYRSSRPDSWTMPRQPLDASMRRIAHGPIRPMEEPGLLARLSAVLKTGAFDRR